MWRELTEEKDTTDQALGLDLGKDFGYKTEAAGFDNRFDDGRGTSNFCSGSGSGASRTHPLSPFEAATICDRLIQGTVLPALSSSQMDVSTNAVSPIRFCFILAGQSELPNVLSSMHPDNYDPDDPAYRADAWPVAKVTAAPLWWDDRSDNLRALQVRRAFANVCGWIKFRVASPYPTCLHLSPPVPFPVLSPFRTLLSPTTPPSGPLYHALQRTPLPLGWTSQKAVEGGR